MRCGRHPSRRRTKRVASAAAGRCLREWRRGRPGVERAARLGAQRFRALRPGRGAARLDDEVASIRSAAEAAGAFLAGLPEEEARRSAELGAAAIELGERRAQLAHAEQEIARAGADAEAREAAERARARAADHVAVAQARVDRAEAAVSDLRRDAEKVPAQLPVLLERATRVESSPPPVDASSLVDGHRARTRRSSSPCGSWTRVASA